MEKDVKTLCMRISNKLHQQLMNKQFALSKKEKKRVSIASLIRDALNRYFTNDKKEE